MSTKQLLALLNSHVEGDEENFLSIALQFAAQEARQGRTEEADKVKRLVQKARDQQRTGRPATGQTPIPLARPRGDLQGLGVCPRIDDGWRCSCDRQGSLSA